MSDLSPAQHPGDGGTAEEGPAVPPELLPFPDRGGRRPDLDATLGAFLTDESAALDECRYEEWLDLLDEMFVYQVPVPLLREDPALPRHSDTGMLFEATKRILQLKLGRVGLRHAWADRPGGIVRHFLGGIRVFDAAGADTLRVDCNVLATFHRGREESALVTAARQDIVTRTETGGYRLLRRRVLLDTEVATHTQLSIIF